MFQTRSTRWVAGTAAVCLALVALTYVLLVGPRRDEAAQLSDQTVAALDRNDALTLRIAQLRADFVKLPQHQAELVAIQQQITPVADTPTLVRSLTSFARASGVSLESLTPGPSTVLDVAPGAAPGVVAAPGQLVSVPQSLVVKGDFFEAVAFLRSLQSEMKRAFLITGLDVAGATAGASSATEGEITLTITGNTFVQPTVATAPGSSALTAAAPGLPTPNPTETR